MQGYPKHGLFSTYKQKKLFAAMPAYSSLFILLGMTIQANYLKRDLHLYFVPILRVRDSTVSEWGLWDKGNCRG